MMLKSENTPLSPSPKARALDASEVILDELGSNAALEAVDRTGLREATKEFRRRLN